MMVFARASAFRGALKAVRPSKTSVGRAQQWRQIGRRGYATHGHEPKAASSDLPWLVGAVAVTVPTCWWLLQPGTDTGHGHGGHGDAHGEDHEEDHGEGHDEEHEGKESEQESESSDDDKSSEEGEDSDSGDESKEASTPDTSDDESDKDRKGGSSADIPNTPKGEKKVMPDSKGAKLRIDSEKGQKQGKPEDLDEGAYKESKDFPASSKPAGSQNLQSGKQEGLSNTDTKHSTDYTNNPEKSKKGEGMPETAKAKGTIDPKRPQV